jgi:hypothetical protein
MPLPPPVAGGPGQVSGGLAGMLAAAAASGSKLSPPQLQLLQQQYSAQGSPLVTGMDAPQVGADDLLFAPEPGTSFPSSVGSIGSGGVKMSPPFLQSSPQLLSTSPLVGNAMAPYQIKDVLRGQIPPGVMVDRTGVSASLLLLLLCLPSFLRLMYSPRTRAAGQRYDPLLI